MGETAPLRLSEKEANLIRLIRDIGFGELRVMVADGQPVRAEDIRKSIKF